MNEKTKHCTVISGDRYFKLIREKAIDPKVVFLIQISDEGHIVQFPARWNKDHRCYEHNRTGEVARMYNKVDLSRQLKEHAPDLIYTTLTGEDV